LKLDLGQQKQITKEETFEYLRLMYRRRALEAQVVNHPHSVEETEELIEKLQEAVVEYESFFESLVESYDLHRDAGDDVRFDGGSRTLSIVSTDHQLKEKVLTRARGEFLAKEAQKVVESSKDDRDALLEMYLKK